MTFLLAPKRKIIIIFVLKVICPQYTLACPIWATSHFLVFQNACPNLNLESEFNLPQAIGQALT